MKIIDADAHTKATHIEMLVMDVDGTLTDGAMYYGAEGEELKRFSTRDGMGVTLLQRSGIQCAIITSENSPIVAARAKKLGIENVILSSRQKPDSLRELSEAMSLALKSIAYIGDDVNDIQVMQIVGLSACVADAAEQVQSVSHVICSKSGGYGAVREFAEFILLSQGKPITLPEKW
ncbi:MAG: HAD-IIIA family hydrolase [Ignavibacteria bacterium]|nr:HAD-IIIA family hydrolase [Ignavibacteria bacterium]